MPQYWPFASNQRANCALGVTIFMLLVLHPGTGLTGPPVTLWTNIRKWLNGEAGAMTLREQITINNGLVQQVAETLELQALTDEQMAAREAAGKAISDRKMGGYA